MNRSHFLIIIAALLVMPLWAQAQEVQIEPPTEESLLDAPPDEYTPPAPFTQVYRDDLFAMITTSEGVMKFRLVGRDSPTNVINFVNLARGAKEFVNLTGARVFRRFYDGLTFHKVLRDFVIQGGCPRGDGTGGPGFQTPDELNPRLRLDEPGVLGIANYGDNTNGSQFFVTTGYHSSLNEKYTVIGRLVEGWQVLQRINRRTVNGMARPVYPVVIERIDILAGEEII